MKIHDADKDIERQDKEAKIKRVKHQSIERKYHTYETLTDVIRNEYKSEPQTKFTVRVNKELATNLRVYAEEKELSVNQSIIHLCERYFNDNWMTRGFFKLEKPFTVAIPIITKELEKYIKDDINCLIDMTYDIESRLAVQSQLISNDETDYYLAVTFKHGNNYLDTYQAIDESYFAGNLKGTHIGLYDIYLEHLQTSIFLRVVFQDKTPIKATILTKNDAMKNARLVQNQMLINYIENIDQANTFEDVKQSIREKEIYIKTLEQKVQMLENELSLIKDANADESQEDTSPEETQDMTLDLSPTIPSIPKETREILINSIIDMHNISETYRKIMQTSMKPIIDAGLNYHMALKKIADDDTKSEDIN